ncbi:amidohydrolase family protein [Belliella kenyensis]|uniref:Amidohydrolase family protein n=1 Tax=Belliella kenyensis TaxID=1472724 RepID=A0ABV8EHN4_9BACT|nr:amidohydrolase family protein [Belliella kenyensis]MCH7402666.1 amidohydrolase family protein [Belliella kenyensis]MDN3603786.1 amidohydrolase family protein [Belliella kenyensis]
MKLKFYSPILLVILCFISITNNSFSQKILFKDVNLIPMTSDTLLISQSVLVQDGKIVAIDDYKNLKPKKKSKTQVIAAKGKFLMPSLVDMHVHLPDEDRVEEFLKYNLAAGVLHLRVMNSVMDQDELKRVIDAEDGVLRPSIHFSHLIRRDKSYTIHQADSLMKKMKETEERFVKLLSLGSEETFGNLSAAAKSNGVIFCGHFPVYQKFGQAYMVDMDKVLHSGFRSVEHLGGYIWLQSDDQIEKSIQITKLNEVYNCPTLDWDVMTSNLLYPKGYKDRFTYKLLPIEITKKWEADYKSYIDELGGLEMIQGSMEKNQGAFEAKKKILKDLYDAGCLLLIGGDAGTHFQAPGFNIYEEMLHWSDIGIDNYSILRSATYHAAKFFGEHSTWGTIEVGKNAEMILLTSNPLEDIRNIGTIEQTVFGKLIFDNGQFIKSLKELSK